MYARMCVGGCIPAASVWICVWGGRRCRAQAQLHALGREQRDQACQSSITLRWTVCSTLSTEREREGERDEVEKEDKEPVERNMDGSEGERGLKRPKCEQGVSLRVTEEEMKRKGRGKCEGGVFPFSVILELSLPNGRRGGERRQGASSGVLFRWSGNLGKPLQCQNRWGLCEKIYNWDELMHRLARCVEVRKLERVWMSYHILCEPTLWMRFEERLTTCSIILKFKCWWCFSPLSDCQFLTPPLEQL